MKLKAAFTKNPRLEPLLDGSISTEEIEFEWEIASLASLQLRHLKENTFDLFEFSLSGYLVTREKPELAHLGWIALPIFLSKALSPFELCVNVRSGIHTWEDLAGKRVAVPDFHMTTVIWLRIMLRHLYGIQPADITWINVRRPTERHSSLMGFRQPPGVSLLDIEAGTSLNQMLERGEVDVALGTISESPNVRRLLGTHQAKQILATFFQQTGATPVNHVAIVQHHLLPLAPVLYDLLERAKQESYRRAWQAAEAYLLFPSDDFARQADIFGQDPFPSGVAANRRMLELLWEQLLAEGQIETPLALEDAFAEQG